MTNVSQTLNCNLLTTTVIYLVILYEMFFLVVFHMVAHHGELMLNTLNIYKISSSILEWFYLCTSEQQTNVFLIGITLNFRFFSYANVHVCTLSVKHEQVRCTQKWK